MTYFKISKKSMVYGTVTGTGYMVTVKTIPVDLELQLSILTHCFRAI